MSNNFKSGFAGIVGRPNVGKSTLLNRMIGQKIAIVSPKPQTTRGKILAVMTEDAGQAVFLDTPGFHKPKNKLGEAMVKAVSDTISDVDVIIMVVEPYAKCTAAESDIIDDIKKRGDIPCILVINKADTVDRPSLLPVMEFYGKIYDFAEIIPISAKNGMGIDDLKKAIFKYFEEGPMFYPEDVVTDQHEKHIVCEIIREKMLRLLDKEVPHGTAVEVIKMKNSGSEDKPVYNICANIYCEKASHKGIIIGSGGSMLKKIGTLSRIDCEKLLDAKVYLELWVKIKQDWRNSDSLMKEIGIIGTEGTDISGL